MIINSPIRTANERIFLKKHIALFADIFTRVVVIVGNYADKRFDNVRVVNFTERRLNHSIIDRVGNQLLAQLRLTFYLVRHSSRIQLVFFDIGEYRNCLPLLFSKILLKKTVVFHRGGNKALESRLENQLKFSKIIPPVQDAMMRFCYHVVDGILVESPSIVGFGNLQKYKEKIAIYGGDYIDTNRFKINKIPSSRDFVIGYIGRLTPKKGLIKLIRAIPTISKHERHCTFTIVGSGEQKSELEQTVKQLGLETLVEFIPWISDKDMPKYLNDFKLFVLPSSEEGVPAILKEAMACGAIVLATPVGGIPDLINDGKTGFIFRDDDEQAIARTIIDVLRNQSLDDIATEARLAIEKQNSFQSSTNAWKSLLCLWHD